MSVVIGCPVRRRAWVMDRWFDHAIAALEAAGVEWSWAFVVDPADETNRVIDARADGEVVRLPADDQEPWDGVERAWHLAARVGHLVALRNRLLSYVRRRRPDAFVSVDSDVLLHPQAIADMLESLQRYDAVGGATFMTPPPRRPGPFPIGHRAPSCGWIIDGGLNRRPIEARGVIPVGVIMAVKTMTPAAYAVDYAPHADGEDVGWSRSASRAGLQLGWDSRHPSKHVMSEDALDQVDERVGF